MTHFSYLWLVALNTFYTCEQWEQRIELKKTSCSLFCPHETPLRDTYKTTQVRNSDECSFCFHQVTVHFISTCIIPCLELIRWYFVLMRPLCTTSPRLISTCPNDSCEERSFRTFTNRISCLQICDVMPMLLPLRKNWNDCSSYFWPQYGSFLLMEAPQAWTRKFHSKPGHGISSPSRECTVWNLEKDDDDNDNKF